MPREHIKLAHAHVNQITSKGVKGEWKIQANITEEDLGVLPANLTHTQVFDILNTARKYELEAFNKGIDFGKEQYKNAYDITMNDLQNRLHGATQENERLAEAIEIITNNK